RTVTGVQTCALPISLLDGLRAQHPDRATGLVQALGHHPAGGLEVAADPTAVAAFQRLLDTLELDRGRGEGLRQGVVDVPGDAGEIGRASCRERAESR